MKKLFFPLPVFLTGLLIPLLLFSGDRESVSPEKTPGAPPRHGRKMRRHPPMMGHPLLFALENKEDFSDEERARLKKLAAEDPGKFNREMHVFFQQKRKKTAETILKLRTECLNAKDEKSRRAAEESLRKQVRAEVERQLTFHQRIIAGIEENIRNMQKRLEDVRKDYDRKVKTKDAQVEQRLQKLLDPEKVPARLLMDLKADPNTPPPPPPKKKGPPPEF